MKEGRWVKLGRVLGEDNSLSKIERSPWAIKVRGPVALGEAVRTVTKAGDAQIRYVVGIVRQAQRTYERSIAIVGMMPPVPEEPAASATAGPLPRPRPTERRNPRECETCGGRCSPGAGRCHECREGQNSDEVRQE